MDEKRVVAAEGEKEAAAMANGETPLDQPVILVVAGASVIGVDRPERRPKFNRVEYMREYMRAWRARKRV